MADINSIKGNIARGFSESDVLLEQEAQENRQQLKDFTTSFSSDPLGTIRQLAQNQSANLTDNGDRATIPGLGLEAVSQLGEYVAPWFEGIDDGAARIYDDIAGSKAGQFVYNALDNIKLPSAAPGLIEGGDTSVADLVGGLTRFTLRDFVPSLIEETAQGVLRSPRSFSNLLEGLQDINTVGGDNAYQTAGKVTGLLVNPLWETVSPYIGAKGLYGAGKAFSGLFTQPVRKAFEKFGGGVLGGKYTGILDDVAKGATPTIGKNLAGTAGGLFDTYIAGSPLSYGLTKLLSSSFGKTGIGKFTGNLAGIGGGLLTAPGFKGGVASFFDSSAFNDIGNESSKEHLNKEYNASFTKDTYDAFREEFNQNYNDYQFATDMQTKQNAYNNLKILSNQQGINIYSAEDLEKVNNDVNKGNWRNNVLNVLNASAFADDYVNTKNNIIEKTFGDIYGFSNEIPLQKPIDQQVRETPLSVSIQGDNVIIDDSTTANIQNDLPSNIYEGLTEGGELKSEDPVIQMILNGLDSETRTGLNNALTTLAPHEKPIVRGFLDRQRQAILDVSNMIDELEEVDPGNQLIFKAEEAINKFISDSNNVYKEYAKRTETTNALISEEAKRNIEARQQAIEEGKDPGKIKLNPISTDLSGLNDFYGGELTAYRRELAVEVQKKAGGGGVSGTLGLWNKRIAKTIGALMEDVDIGYIQPSVVDVEGVGNNHPLRNLTVVITNDFPELAGGLSLYAAGQFGLGKLKQIASNRTAVTNPGLNSIIKESRKLGGEIVEEFTQEVGLQTIQGRVIEGDDIATTVLTTLIGGKNFVDGVKQSKFNDLLNVGSQEALDATVRKLQESSRKLQQLPIGDVEKLVLDTVSDIKDIAKKDPKLTKQLFSRTNQIEFFKQRFNIIKERVNQDIGVQLSNTEYDPSGPLTEQSFNNVRKALDQGKLGAIGTARFDSSLNNILEYTPEYTSVMSTLDSSVKERQRRTLEQYDNMVRNDGITVTDFATAIQTGLVDGTKKEINRGDEFKDRKTVGQILGNVINLPDGKTRIANLNSGDDIRRLISQNTQLSGRSKKIYTSYLDNRGLTQSQFESEVNDYTLGRLLLRPLRWLNPGRYYKRVLDINHNPIWDQEEVIFDAEKDRTFDFIDAILESNNLMAEALTPHTDRANLLDLSTTERFEGGFFLNNTSIIRSYDAFRDTERIEGETNSQYASRLKARKDKEKEINYLIMSWNYALNYDSALRSSTTGRFVSKFARERFKPGQYSPPRIYEQILAEVYGINVNKFAYDIHRSEVGTPIRIDARDDRGFIVFKFTGDAQKDILLNTIINKSRFAGDFADSRKDFESSVEEYMNRFGEDEFILQLEQGTPFLNDGYLYLIEKFVNENLRTVYDKARLQPSEAYNLYMNIGRALYPDPNTLTKKEYKKILTEYFDVLSNSKLSTMRSLSYNRYSKNADTARLEKSLKETLVNNNKYEDGEKNFDDINNLSHLKTVVNTGVRELTAQYNLGVKRFNELKKNKSLKTKVTSSQINGITEINNEIGGLSEAEKYEKLLDLYETGEYNREYIVAKLATLDMENHVADMVYYGIDGYMLASEIPKLRQYIEGTREVPDAISKRIEASKKDAKVNKETLIKDLRNLIQERVLNDKEGTKKLDDYIDEDILAIMADNVGFQTNSFELAKYAYFGRLQGLLNIRDPLIDLNNMKRGSVNNSIISEIGDELGVAGGIGDIRDVVFRKYKNNIKALNKRYEKALKRFVPDIKDPILDTVFNDRKSKRDKNTKAKKFTSTTNIPDTFIPIAYVDNKTIKKEVNMETYYKSTSKGNLIYVDSKLGIIPTNEVLNEHIDFINSTNRRALDYEDELSAFSEELAKTGDDFNIVMSIANEEARAIAKLYQYDERHGFYRGFVGEVIPDLRIASIVSSYIPTINSSKSNIEDSLLLAYTENGTIEEYINKVSNRTGDTEDKVINDLAIKLSSHGSYDVTYLEELASNVERTKPEEQIEFVDEIHKISPDLAKELEARLDDVSINEGDVYEGHIFEEQKELTKEQIENNKVVELENERKKKKSLWRRGLEFIFPTQLIDVVQQLPVLRNTLAYFDAKLFTRIPAENRPYMKDVFDNLYVRYLEGGDMFLAELDTDLKNVLRGEPANLPETASLVYAIEWMQSPLGTESRVLPVEVMEAIASIKDDVMSSGDSIWLDPGKLHTLYTYSSQRASGLKIIGALSERAYSVIDRNFNTVFENQTVSSKDIDFYKGSEGYHKNENSDWFLKMALRVPGIRQVAGSKKLAGGVMRNVLRSTLKVINSGRQDIANIALLLPSAVGRIAGVKDGLFSKDQFRKSVASASKISMIVGYVIGVSNGALAVVNQGISYFVRRQAYLNGLSGLATEGELSNLVNDLGLGFDPNELFEGISLGPQNLIYDIVGRDTFSRAVIDNYLRQTNQTIPELYSAPGILKADVEQELREFYTSNFQNVFGISDVPRLTKFNYSLVGATLNFLGGWGLSLTKQTGKNLAGGLRRKFVREIEDGNFGGANDSVRLNYEMNRSFQSIAYGLLWAMRWLYFIGDEDDDDITPKEKLIKTVSRLYEYMSGFNIEKQGLESSPITRILTEIVGLGLTDKYSELNEEGNILTTSKILGMKAILEIFGQFGRATAPSRAVYAGLIRYMETGDIESGMEMIQEFIDRRRTGYMNYISESVNNQLQSYVPRTKNNIYDSFLGLQTSEMKKTLYSTKDKVNMLEYTLVPEVFWQELLYKAPLVNDIYNIITEGETPQPFTDVDDMKAVLQILTDDEGIQQLRDGQFPEDASADFYKFLWARMTEYNYRLKFDDGKVVDGPYNEDGERKIYDEGKGEALNQQLKEVLGEKLYFDTMKQISNITTNNEYSTAQLGVIADAIVRIEAKAPGGLKSAVGVMASIMENKLARELGYRSAGDENYYEGPDQAVVQQLIARTVGPILYDSTGDANNRRNAGEAIRDSDTKDWSEVMGFYFNEKYGELYPEFVSEIKRNDEGELKVFSSNGLANAQMKNALLLDTISHIAVNEGDLDALAIHNPLEALSRSYADSEELGFKQVVDENGNTKWVEGEKRDEYLDRKAKLIATGLSRYLETIEKSPHASATKSYLVAAAVVSNEETLERIVGNPELRASLGEETINHIASMVWGAEEDLRSVEGVVKELEDLAGDISGGLSGAGTYSSYFGSNAKGIAKKVGNIAPKFKKFIRNNLSNLKIDGKVKAKRSKSRYGKQQREYKLAKARYATINSRDITKGLTKQSTKRYKIKRGRVKKAKKLKPIISE